MFKIKKIRNLKIFDGSHFTFLCLLREKLKLKLYPKDDRLLEFKNKFRGERCFIIALGPSLTANDLELIASHHEYTFSMNRCYQFFDKTSWRPDFYFISDNRGFTPELRKFIKEMISDGITIIYNKFAIPKGMPKCALYYKVNFLDVILKMSQNKKYRDKARHTRFSTDAYDYIYDGSTCVHSIIQLAYYMGFSEIYLVGCDCGVVDDKSYSDLLDNPVKNIENMNKLGDEYILDYQSLKDDIEKKSLDLKIFNSTRGGRLNIFPRISLDDLFSDLKFSSYKEIDNR